MHAVRCTRDFHLLPITDNAIGISYDLSSKMYAVRATARTANRAVTKISRRNMGGGAQVEYEGIDKVVRSVFPEDWQRKCE